MAELTYFEAVTFTCGCRANWQKINVDDIQGEYDIVWVIEAPCRKHKDQMNMWEERIREL